VARALFRFHGSLGLFLPKGWRQTAFAYDCARAATLKNAIEALGVPHTEAGTVTVNGAPATLQRALREGDAVEVFPCEEQSVPDPDFLADAHLGGLARFLRMMGFDTLHENGMVDEEIRRLAREEQRIVLTRDRALPGMQPPARAGGKERGRGAAGAAGVGASRQLHPLPGVRPRVLARLAL
jgi:hypothetical protein